jgi:hypothetical protein
MKKLIFSLTIMLMCAAGFAQQDANGNIGTSGLTWAFTVADSTLTIGMGTSTTGVMPASTWQSNQNLAAWNNANTANLNAIAVVVIQDGITEIGNNNFRVHPNLRSVTLPTSGLTRIGDNAFTASRNLTSITLPEGITVMGTGVFMDCSGLETANIPSTVVSSGAAGSTNGTLGNFMFGGCVNLTSAIVIPNGITIIGANAFQNCSLVSSITLPANLVTINGTAFENCLVATFNAIPATVTTIAFNAFRNCRGLTSVTIPVGVTVFNQAAFAGCTGLTAINVASGNTALQSINGVVFNAAGTILHQYPAGKPGAYVIPDGVTTLTQQAFEGATLLTAITFPATGFTGGAQGIPAWTFSGCTALQSVNIPAGVTQLQMGVFQNCTNLTSVTFDGTPTLTTIGGDVFRNTGLTSFTVPATTTSIQGSAFAGCNNLTAINVNSENTTFFSNDGVLYFTNWGTFQLMVYPAGKTGTSFTVPGTVGAFTVRNIAGGAFQNNTFVESIIISDSITGIGDDAFNGCSDLATVTIGSRVATIGQRAFANTNLNFVTNFAPVPITNLNANVFDNTPIDEATLKVRSGSLLAYQSTNVWRNFGNIIGDNLYVELTANNAEWGSVAGSGDFSAGTSATIAAVPASGFRFVRWTMNGVLVTINNPHTFPVTMDVELVAVFEALPAAHAITLSGGANGSVVGAGSYVVNTQATVAAVPNTGYQFVNWTTASKEIVSLNNPHTFTVTGPVALVANFEVIPDPEVYTVKLTVDNDYFKNWTKDGSVVSTANPYTFDVSENVELVANFNDIPNSIGTFQTTTPLNIFPNPSRGMTKVDAGGLNIDRITILNGNGHTVYSKANVNRSSYEFNTEQFTAGFYFVTVQTPSGTVSTRLIVK